MRSNPTTQSLLVGGLLLAVAAYGQAPAAWTPELSMTVRTIGPVVPSPDGTRVAWTQTAAVIDTETSEMNTQIWVSKADGSGRFQLTHGKKPASDPQWSPDGKWIFFTSSRNGKNDVFRIRIDGGEAEQLTEVKGGVERIAVSKNGRWLAYATAEPDPEREKAAREKRDMRVVDANPKNARIYVVPVEADSRGKREPRVLTPAGMHVMGLAWSSDGARIAFVYWATPEVNEWRKSKLAEVDTASGAVKELATVAAFAAAPLYSPDGRYIAFPQNSAETPYPGASRIALYDRSSGQVRQLAATPNESPRMAGWKPDGRSVIVSEPKQTTTAMLEIPVDGPVKELFVPEKGILGSVDMDDAGKVFGVSHEAPDTAPEAYVLAAGTGKLTQVSAANSHLPNLPLGKTEVFRWKAKDGRQIEGMLTYPVGYQAGKKAPLILNIHGGPAGQFNQNFIGRGALYPIAVFAAKGYAVLRPNPRGSTGYGKEFRYSNLADWGGGDYQDDQAGVDALIAQGIADPERMAVMGWSYGGYMTSWTIGHTTRFKAAAVGAGVTNLRSFTGTTDIGDFLPDYMGGEFWEKKELYEAQSPIAYVANVTTPTLVLHGEADDRVPLGQGIEYYNALKRRGVPTQMVIYPRTPHGPREPKFVLDIMQRHLDWVEKYLP